MSVSGSSGSSVVTGNVNTDSAPALINESSQEAKYIYTTQNGSIITNYTVPAGFRFRLTGWALAHAATAAVTLMDTAGTGFISNAQCVANGSFILFPGYDIHIYESGEFVKSSGTTGSHPIIYGILEPNP